MELLRCLHGYEEEMLSLHKYHFSFIACSSNPHHQATMQATVVRVVPRDTVCSINTVVDQVTCVDQQAWIM